jgi:serine protease Do
MKRLGIIVLLLMMRNLYPEPPRRMSFPTQEEGKGSPFVEIVEKILPTVVSIEAKRVVNITSPFQDFFEDPFFEWFFQGKPPVPKKAIRPILGSGVIVSKDGYILTNNHIIEKAEELTVKTMDEKEYKAKIIGKDPMTDIAVIKIEGKNFPYAKLGDSDKIKVGEWVIAIGNPFYLFGTVTVGIISAKGRKNVFTRGEGAQIQNFIQTDAAINPGNSGGPLVNLKSEVIGINTAIKTAGGGNIGIGFAIPSNMAKKVMQDLIKYKKVKRGYLGITYQKMNKELAEAYGLKEVKGVLVQRVIEDSPAEKGGLNPEDIILEWNGKEVNFENFSNLVFNTEVNKRVKLKVWRKGKEITLYVKVGERGEIKKSEIEEWFGIRVVDTEDEKAKILGVRENRGVVVIDVDKEKEGWKRGIRKGDVIEKVGEIKIKGIKDYLRAIKKYKDKQKPIVFKIKRKGEVIFFALKEERNEK